VMRGLEAGTWWEGDSLMLRSKRYEAEQGGLEGRSNATERIVEDRKGKKRTKRSPREGDRSMTWRRRYTNPIQETE